MAPAVAASPGADAELIDLCRRWVYLHRVYIDTERQAIDAEGVDRARTLPICPGPLLRHAQAWLLRCADFSEGLSGSTAMLMCPQDQEKHFLEAERQTSMDCQVRWPPKGADLAG